ncbi:MAG: type II secretion system minor pseudopilin GspK [Parvularculaceae bacterium]
MTPAKPLASQRGSALIISLLMVATFAFIAVAITERTALAIRRASITAARAELQWRAVSAEALAADAIRQAVEALDGETARLTPEIPLFASPIVAPLPGGAAELRFRDATRCFNVNALVRIQPEDDPGQNPGQNSNQTGDASDGDDEDDENDGDGENDDRSPGFGDDDDEDAGTPELDEGAVRERAALAAAIGLGTADGERLAGVIADWIDGDDFAGFGGAEDSLYTTLPTPFRTGAAPLASVSELRAMDGVNRDLYLAFLPHLCALPERAPTRINVNFLEPRDAPILAALSEGALSAQEAERIIADRPPGGWESVEAFWEQGALSELEISEPARVARTAVTSSYVETIARVRLGEIDTGARLVFNVGESGPPRLVSREYGVLN